ncbi:MAG: AAA family ATPase [Proteobacteria bacterium]|jgi:MoxR-like ATPase|nr:AAA family ATPase [Pseudomonadota bacterium]NCV22048.1 AAA family ATPase [Chloroflexota bacterium]NBQ62324.1 AAA family ATPase [Pseudomonadota bacterium]NBT04287.1 AAA family ATPase [Pseudomonadota bacterium]NBT19163.1 AAA family ATPase [Pseudomonadota bacterium]
MSEELSAVASRIIANVERVILGKRTEIELALMAVLSRGHILIEDVPGTGKTMLARALALSVGCTFKRIQFTPDLLPSDVTGVTVYNQKHGEFEFRRGPIHAQMVLADEINRATPKTQSALLEAMEERQVTVDGTSYALPAPFLVMATQNPIEYEGTFPLPEAQLDRFMMRIRLGYPARADEIAILTAQKEQHPIETISEVISADGLRDLQASVARTHVDRLITEYVVDVATATRDHQEVYLGASPRGSSALLRAAQARAVIQGRDFVSPDDVKALAESTLAHRLIVSPGARMRNVEPRTIIRQALDTVPVPGARAVRV